MPKKQNKMATNNTNRAINALKEPSGQGIGTVETLFPHLYFLFNVPEDMRNRMSHFN